MLKNKFTFSWIEIARMARREEDEYQSYLTNEQEWFGASKCEVIFGRYSISINSVSSRCPSGDVVNLFESLY